MSNTLRYSLYLLGLAGAAWIVAWTVPSQEWHFLPEIWGFVALVVLSLLALPLTAVLFHELAHGAAALMTGYKVFSIVFWAPIPLVHVRLFGIWFACGRPLRGSGYCIAYPKRLPSSRPLLYPAAGPIMSLILSLAASAACLRLPHGLLYYWLIGAVFLNLLYFVGAIIPRQAWIAGGPALTDGAQIIAALRPAQPSDTLELKLTYAWGLTLQGRWSESESLVRECSEEIPNHPQAQNFQAWLLWRHGKLKEAIELLGTCLNDARMGIEAKGSLAILLSMEGACRNLERAEALSQELMSGVRPGARRTMIRGIVLQALGRIEEALHLFSIAYGTLLDPRDRGYVAATLGTYWLANGNSRQADRLLRQALYLGVETSVIRRLARGIRQRKKESSSPLAPGA